MNQQRKRKMKRLRSKYTYSLSSGNIRTEGDGWIEAYPKTKTKTSCDSDSDDNLRLDQLNKKQSKAVRKTTKKNSTKQSKTPISVGKKGWSSWNDGCGSDDDNVSRSSERRAMSARERKKRGNKRKSSNRSNIKALTMKASKCKSQQEGNTSSNSSSESDRSIEEVKKKFHNKKANREEANKFSMKKLASKSSKREAKHRGQNDESDGDSESDRSVAEVEKNLNVKKRPNGTNITRNAKQSMKREMKRRKWKYRNNDSSATSSSESDSSVAEVKVQTHNKKPNKKRPNQPNTKKTTLRIEREEGKQKRRKHEARSRSSSSSSSSSDSESDGSVEEVMKTGSNKNYPNQSNTNTPAAQCSKRDIKLKRRKVDSSSSSSSSSSESGKNVEKVKERVIIRKHSNIPNINKPPAQSSRHNSQQPKIIIRTALDNTISAEMRQHGNTNSAPSREMMKLVETKVNGATISEDITSVSQLQWYRIRLLQTEERTRETLQPCRILSRGEASIFLRNNKSSASARTNVIQYLTFPNANEGLYKCVDRSLLIPFGYDSKDGLSTTFNDDYLQRYLLQLGKITRSFDLEAIKLFLKRVFEHARDTATKSRHQASQELEDYHDDGSSYDGNDESDVLSRKFSDSKRVQFEVTENLDDRDDTGNIEIDDLDAPYTQAINFDPDDFGTVEEQSNEPIRPGDLIEYYSPIFVAGDARGLRQAGVLAVDPNEEMPLTLSNGEGIPDCTKVKRIKVMLEGELVDHPGIYRPIYRFRLVKKGSATAADAIAMEASRFGRIMQKNMSKLKEAAQADGFAPMDLLVNMKGVNTESPVKAPSRVNSPIAISSRGKETGSLLSSSSDDDDDRSECDNQKAKQKKKPPKKKIVTTRAAKSNGDEEIYSALGKGNQKRLGPLSSAASLGSSLASSDDSSIDSTLQNLGRNPALSNCKKVNMEAQNGAVALDFSRLSGDGNTSWSKKERDKCKTPSKACSYSALLSPNSVSSESSLLQTPNSSGLRNQLASKKISATIGSSKRRLKLGPTSEKKRIPSLSSVFGKDEKDTGRKPQMQRKPFSPLFEDSSSSGNKFSKRGIRTQAKSTPKTKSRALLLRCSSSSDSVQIVNGDESNPITGKRSSPPPSLFSSDDSGDNRRSKPPQMHPSKGKIPQKRVQALDLFGPGCHSSKDCKHAPRERSSPNHIAIDSAGWTQGKAGWEKRDSGSFGFAIGRNK